MTATKNTNGNGATSVRVIWASVISALSAVALMIGIMGSFITPLSSSVEQNRKDIDKTLSWQEDYSRGKIPSSAEKEMGSIKMQFIEVETQFKWFKQVADERNLVLLKEIERLQKELEILKNKK